MKLDKTHESTARTWSYPSIIIIIIIIIIIPNCSVHKRHWNICHIKDFFEIISLWPELSLSWLNL